MRDFWEEHSLDRIPIPADIEQVIVTPHDHEGANNRALWLIWVRSPFGINLGVDPNKLDFPVLDSVADSEDSARAHYRMAVYNNHHFNKQDAVYVERVPANHRFASSLGNWQHEAHIAMWKARHNHANRTGD